MQSESYKMDFHRQLGILDPSTVKERVMVIGAGGIGSPTVLCLSKMGISNISVYDFDSVEVHNRPNQVYRRQDIGKPKVDALQDICESFSDVVIEAHNQKVTPDWKPSGIIVMAVDSITTRTELWKAVRYNSACPLLVDARMGGEVGKVITVRPTNRTDVQYYESTLHSEEVAVNTPCTERAIMYNVFIISGVICSMIKKFSRGEKLTPQVLVDCAATLVAEF